MTDNQLAGYFSYLDKLNRMAITNMRRASFYLECRFLIDREQADIILQAWLLTFDTHSMPSMSHFAVAEA
jgi:hypothetical protein